MRGQSESIYSWQYENFTDEELQKIAISKFGYVLRSIKEIGREAVIEELQKYDEYLQIKRRNK